MTLYIMRKNSWFAIGMATIAMLEYIYFLFSFPVEEWHFLRRAIAKDKPYSQFIRTSYLERFGEESRKGRMYVNF